MGDEVVAISKEHSTVNTDVITTIHFAVAVGGSAPHALRLAIRPLRPMNQLMIQQILLSCEALTTGAADHSPVLLIG